MIKNRFFRNTFWLLFGQVFRMLISFVIGIITARYLGPTNNGTITYISSYTSFFTAIVGLGLNGVIIHEFVNHREEEGRILGTAIWLRFVLGLLSMVLMLGVVYITDGNDKTMLTVALLQSVQLPFLCWDTVNYWYQSHMQSKYSVIAQTVAYMGAAAYKVYLLVTGKGIEWFSFAVSVDFIILAAMFFGLYQKHKTQKLSYSFETAKRLLKSCLPFVLANLMVVIYGHMDRIMIKAILGNTRDVGLYSAAITVCGIVGFIPVALLDSARPIISKAKKENEEEYQLRFRQLVAGVMYICILYSLFVTVFAGFIMNLMYGAQYTGATTCLKIAVWYTAFSYLGSARSFWLICEDKKRYVIVFSFAGACCNIALNLLLIPRWGINGAAFATLITQLLTNVVIPIAFKGTRKYGQEVIKALFLKDIQLKELCKAAVGKLTAKSKK